MGLKGCMVLRRLQRLPGGPDLSRDPGKSQQQLLGGCGMVTGHQGYRTSGILGSGSAFSSGVPARWYQRQQQVISAEQRDRQGVQPNGAGRNRQ